MGGVWALGRLWMFDLGVRPEGLSRSKTLKRVREREREREEKKREREMGRACNSHDFEACSLEKTSCENCRARRTLEPQDGTKCGCFGSPDSAKSKKG